jgi:hypothetical protein
MSLLRVIKGSKKIEPNEEVLASTIVTLQKCIKVREQCSQTMPSANKHFVSS